MIRVESMPMTDEQRAELSALVDLAISKGKADSSQWRSLIPAFLVVAAVGAVACGWLLTLMDDNWRGLGGTARVWSVAAFIIWLCFLALFWMLQGWAKRQMQDRVLRLQSDLSSATIEQVDISVDHVWTMHAGQIEDVLYLVDDMQAVLIRPHVFAELGCALGETSPICPLKLSLSVTPKSKQVLKTGSTLDAMVPSRSVLLKSDWHGDYWRVIPFDAAIELVAQTKLHEDVRKELAP